MKHPKMLVAKDNTVSIPVLAINKEGDSRTALLMGFSTVTLFSSAGPGPNEHHSSARSIYESLLKRSDHPGEFWLELGSRTIYLDPNLNRENYMRCKQSKNAPDVYDLPYRYYYWSFFDPDDLQRETMKGLSVYYELKDMPTTNQEGLQYLEEV
jgi:hypothetical protein